MRVLALASELGKKTGPDSESAREREPGMKR